MADCEPAQDSEGATTPKAKPLKSDLVKTWCMLGSILVSLFALSAMLGWHTGKSTLFQIFPQFAPMQYNTALGFLSAAVATFFAYKQWRLTALLTALPGLIITLLTLTEHIYGVDIGKLDRLFVDPFVTDLTAHPGRSSLPTAISFLLTFAAIYALVLRCTKNLCSQVSAVVCSVVISISLLGLTGYLFGINQALSWNLLAQMSVPTVICFLVLSLALLGLSWRTFRENNNEAPSWLPIAVLIASSTITLILATAIRSEENRTARLKHHNNAVDLKITLGAELANRQRSIRRMANRWAKKGKQDRKSWEADVEEYLVDDIGYSFIAWADENLTYQWVVPETPNITPGVSSASPRLNTSLELLNNLMRAANVGIRRIGSDQSQLCVVAPIVGKDGTFSGYIIAKFNERVFFSTLLPKELAHGYDYTIRMNQQIVHQRGPGGIPKDNPWIIKKNFNLHGADWEIHLWPTSKTLRTEHISYSNLIGGMGLVASGLLSLAIFLAQLAIRKSKQSMRRSIRLQEEVTERIRSEQELQRASALNEAIVLHSAHSVISTDSEGVITSFNPAAERMLGYKAGELVGKHTPAIIHDLGEVAARASQLSKEHNDKVEPGFEAFVYEARKGIDSQVEWTYVRKNGSRFPVSLAASALTNEKGEIIGYLGVAVDISELKYAMAELKNTHKQLLDAANETSRMKSQFLANMSHEIRTPMNGVLGMAELLGDTDLTDAQREYVSIIQQSGNALLAIINDILDSAKIESGKIELQETPLNLREVVKGVIQTLGPIAKKKNIKITSDIDEAIQSNVIGDPGRLRQVLLNLASNAVKFTGKGGVSLIIDLLSEDDLNYKMKFKIRDTGIGINSDSIAHIFQPFTQADDTNKRVYGGTGLGLTISSQIVQTMGGFIRVESKEDEGSEFWFDLAMVKTDELVQQPAAEKPRKEKRKSRSITQVIRLAQQDGRKLNILLAEDNPVNQQVTTMQLKRLGIDTDVVENGQEALMALKKKEYDVVLMDCQMPVMDGYEATREIRKQHGDSIHIIALTANAMKEDRLRCLEAGMDDYLSKPLTAKDLAEALDRMNTHSNPPEPPDETQDDSQAVDFDRLREVTGDDDELFRELSNQYLVQADEIMAELDQAIRAGNHDETRKLAHKLAGSSTTCGMNAVVAPLRALEALPASESSDAGGLHKELEEQLERIRQALNLS